MILRDHRSFSVNDTWRKIDRRNSGFKQNTTETNTLYFDKRPEYGEGGTAMFPIFFRFLTTWQSYMFREAISRVWILKRRRPSYKSLPLCESCLWYHLMCHLFMWSNIIEIKISTDEFISNKKRVFPVQPRCSHIDLEIVVIVLAHSRSV